MNPAIKTAINIVGSQKKLGAACEVSQQAVYPAGWIVRYRYQTARPDCHHCMFCLPRRNRPPHTFCRCCICKRMRAGRYGENTGYLAERGGY